jgi:hypothetical protein
MPISPPMALYGDLERARRIARSWKPLDRLSPADAEIVARAIAEGIAEGRRHALEDGAGASLVAHLATQRPRLKDLPRCSASPRQGRT